LSCRCWPAIPRSTSAQFTWTAKSTTTYARSAMHNHLKTLPMISNDPNARVIVMPIPASAAYSGAGPACTSCMP